MDPIVWMGCDASKKFKSWKGLSSHFPEIDLHIPPRDRLCLPGMGSAGHTTDHGGKLKRLWGAR